MQRYRDAESKDFKFMEAFKVLRKSPKFGACQSSQGVIQKRALEEEGDDPFVSPERPIGSKRAKANRLTARNADRGQIQAAAESMAQAQRQNNLLIAAQNKLLEDKNNIKLFQGTPEGEEYLKLVRMEKLAELRRRLLNQ